MRTNTLTLCPMWHLHLEYLTKHFDCIYFNNDNNLAQLILIQNFRRSAHVAVPLALCPVLSLGLSGRKCTKALIKAPNVISDISFALPYYPH